MSADHAAILESEYPFSGLLRASDRSDILVQVVETVWSTTLELPLLRREEDEHLDRPASGSHTIIGTIHVTGAWPCTVALTATRALAATCAERMYGIPARELGGAEIQDAWGELVNQVGGNLKAMIAPPCHLSLPTLVDGTTYTYRVPGARVINEVTFACLGDRLRVAVLRPED